MVQSLNPASHCLEILASTLIPWAIYTCLWVSLFQESPLTGFNHQQSIDWFSLEPSIFGSKYLLLMYFACLFCWKNPRLFVLTVACAVFNWGHCSPIVTWQPKAKWWSSETLLPWYLLLVVSSDCAQFNQGRKLHFNAINPTAPAVKPVAFIYPDLEIFSELVRLQFIATHHITWKAWDIVRHPVRHFTSFWAASSDLHSTCR